MHSEHRRRERRARLLGAGLAAGVMAVAWSITGWPAPGIAAGLGLGAYLAARPPAPHGGPAGRAP